MKRIFFTVIFCVIYCFTNTGFAFEKDTIINTDQQIIIKSIQTMYKIKPKSFEFGEVDGKGYSMEKEGEMLSRFFDKQILKKRKGGISKIDNEYEVPLRYPKFEDVSSLAEINSPIIPKVKVGTPIIGEGERAKVIVNLSDGSLCQYFLKKLPQGWRIYKVRSFYSARANLYFLSGQGIMIEYPSGIQYYDDKESMKLSEW